MADRDSRLAELRVALEIETAAREQAEAATGTAELACRRKDVFLSYLLHALRTPLTVISMRCDMLLKKPDALGHLETSIHTISDSARALSAIIDNVVEVGRMLAKTPELDTERVDLLECVQDVIAKISNAALEREVEIQWQAGAGEWVTTADGKRLRLALRNLLSNAVRFTPPGETVTVSLERDPAGLVVRVSDPGIGVSPEMSARLLSPQNLGAASGWQPGDGLGLGLPVCRWVAEIHGGSLSMEREGDSQGTSFVLVIPPLP